VTEPGAGELSDAELLAAHVAGDPDAFALIVARHRDRLWAVALRTMGNPHDAADGLQDGLVAAYRRAGSFRGDSAVTTWLHRVVVNACLDRIRAARVRRADALPDDLDEYRDRGSAFTSTSPVEDPESMAEASERRRAVLAALATLPVEQRAALVLVDMEGYPVSEVAQILGCAEGTVKSRCSRGRERLAALLRDRLAEAPPPPVTPVRDRGHPEPEGGVARPIITPPTQTRPAPEGGGP
jgi:RNA polymerase sigma-70 factor, ECF subfamily